MKKVILLNPNTYDNPYAVFPLGLAYIDDALQKSGHVTDWVDLNLETQQDLLTRLRMEPFDYLAITLRNIDDVRIHVQEFFVDQIRELIRAVRQVSSIQIVLGGSGFSIFPVTIFEYCQPDFGIAGEGEQSFLQLLSGATLSKIPGLVYSQGGQTRHNAVALLPQAPQSAPVRNPRIAEYYLRDGGMANLQTQRGCPLKCCYCTYPLIEGKRYRRRRGEEVAEEFVALKATGARYVFIVDSVFNTSAEHVVEICEALVEKGTPLPWGCFMRPKHVTRELLTLMKRAGLKHVEFGSDSMSDPVLEAYQKGFSFEDIRVSSLLAKEVGIDFCHFIIFGGPGETEATMQETFENSKQISGAIIFPSVGMRVYPHTRLHEVSGIAAPTPDSREFGCNCESSHLLKPVYYMAPGLTVEGIGQQIAAFAEVSPNWVDLEHSPEFEAIARRLRQKGVAGPLWNYLSVLRRLS